MELIKQAIERARGIGRPTIPLAPRQPVSVAAGRHKHKFRMMSLDQVHLENARIVAHHASNPMSIGFDMLRTKVLQEMDERRWRTLLITSPTARCGKTVTAINLAMSIARQPERSSILADLDFRKPDVSSSLGLVPASDVHDVIAGRTSLHDALFCTDAAGTRMAILSGGPPVASPAEVLTSPAVKSLISALKRVDEQSTIIIDMPPMLVADDVMAFLPQVDGVLLIAAAGQTKSHEIESCQRNLPEAKVLGIVLTKSNENLNHYHYY